jgi:hypothetical protein
VHTTSSRPSQVTIAQAEAAWGTIVESSAANITHDVCRFGKDALDDPLNVRRFHCIAVFTPANIHTRSFVQIIHALIHTPMHTRMHTPTSRTTSAASGKTPSTTHAMYASLSASLSDYPTCPLTPRAYIHAHLFPFAPTWTTTSRLEKNTLDYPLNVRRITPSSTTSNTRICCIHTFVTSSFTPALTPISTHGVCHFGKDALGYPLNVRLIP